MQTTWNLLAKCVWWRFVTCAAINESQRENKTSGENVKYFRPNRKRKSINTINWSRSSKREFDKHINHLGFWRRPHRDVPPIYIEDLSARCVRSLLVSISMGNRSPLRSPGRFRKGRGTTNSCGIRHNEWLCRVCCSFPKCIEREKDAFEDGAKEKGKQQVSRSCSCPSEGTTKATVT